MAIRILASGVSATAISNIIADVQTAGSNAAASTDIGYSSGPMWAADANGVRVLDSARLIKYLTTQLGLLSNGTTVDAEVTTARAIAPAITATAETPNYVQTAAKAVGVRGLVDALDAKLGVDKWMSRSGFPQPSADSLQESVASTVASLFIDLRRITSQITTLFTDTKKQIIDLVNAYMYEKGYDSQFPAATERYVEDRAYVYTYVNDLSEESAPSPASGLVEIDQNDSVNLTIPKPPASRNVTAYRLYRTNPGMQAAAYQFVAEGAITSAANATYADTLAAEDLGEVLPTTTWAEPPANLIGLTAMPNGILAGFLNNVVCFSESYVPYAWPVEYQITTDSPIVGLGCFDQTLVVCTRGNPYFISGADSASMSAQKLPIPQSCVARRSIAKVPGGVVYASPDGLCLASQQGVQVITEQHYTREDWQALNPANMFCTAHEGTVYIFDGTATIRCLHLPTGKLTTATASGSVTGAWTDDYNDVVYMAIGTSIVALATTTGTRQAGVWKSKKIVLSRHEPFAWLSVQSDFSAGVVVKVYGDGALVYTTPAITSRAAVRLPPGRYLEYEVQVESTARVTAVTLASSTAELQGVE